MHLGCWRAPASAPGSGHLQGIQRGGGSGGGPWKCSSTVKSTARPGGALEAAGRGWRRAWPVPGMVWFWCEETGGRLEESRELRPLHELAVWRQSSTFNCCCQNCDKRAPLIPSPSLTLSRVSARGLKCFHIPAPPLPLLLSLLPLPFGFSLIIFISIVRFSCFVFCGPVKCEQTIKWIWTTRKEKQLERSRAANV